MSLKVPKEIVQQDRDEERPRLEYERVLNGWFAALTPIAEECGGIRMCHGCHTEGTVFSNCDPGCYHHPGYSAECTCASCPECIDEPLDGQGQDERRHSRTDAYLHRKFREILTEVTCQVGGCRNFRWFPKGVVPITMDIEKQTYKLHKVSRGCCCKHLV